MTTARHTMDSADWYTPHAYAKAAREVLGGIGLDPASSPEANLVVQAGEIYTAQDDGLSKPFGGGTIYLNPPGGLVREFWDRLDESFTARRFDAGIWMGYSLEQLQVLQDDGDGQPDLFGYVRRTPLDYPLCYPSRRIAFVENQAKREARLSKLDLENAERRSKGLPPRDRNEDGGSPSHGNYVAYLGPDPEVFKAVFSRLGKVVIPT